MATARWTALAVVGAIVIGAAGCGGSEDDGGTKLSIVTAGTRDDADWSTATASAVERVARRLRVSSEVVEPESDEAAARALRRLAPEAQLLVAPYDGDRATATRAAAATETPLLVWGDPDALRPGLVGDVEVDFPAGAYAAGMLAAQASFERSVGIVLCDDESREELDERFAIAAAYVAGARAKEPRIAARYVITGGDVGSAKLGTVELANKPTQMLLALCGPAVPGVMRGIEQVQRRDLTDETQFVGLVGEKTELNRENVVLTSILVHPEVAFAQALRDVRAGRFGERVYTLDASNGGISLLATGRTPGDAHEAATKVLEGMESDPVELPTASNEVELDAVIAQAGRAGS